MCVRGGGYGGGLVCSATTANDGLLLANNCVGQNATNMIEGNKHDRSQTSALAGVIFPERHRFGPVKDALQHADNQMRFSAMPIEEEKEDAVRA